MSGEALWGACLGEHRSAHPVEDRNLAFAALGEREPKDAVGGDANLGDIGVRPILAVPRCQAVSHRREPGASSPSSLWRSP